MNIDRYLRLEGGATDEEGISSSGSLERFRRFVFAMPRLAAAMLARSGELKSVSGSTPLIMFAGFCRTTKNKTKSRFTSLVSIITMCDRVVGCLERCAGRKISDASKVNGRRRLEDATRRKFQSRSPKPLYALLGGVWTWADHS